MMRATQIPDQW